MVHRNNACERPRQHLPFLPTLKDSGAYRKFELRPHRRAITHACSVVGRRGLALDSPLTSSVPQAYTWGRMQMRICAQDDRAAWQEEAHTQGRAEEIQELK
jgi:hypothetical protein